jgi:glycosyltransferase involved in cell wall biosynthesis
MQSYKTRTVKALWITNVLMPDVAEVLGEKRTYLGGWMVAAANELIKNNDVELYCATVSNQTRTLVKVRKGLITYYLLPLSKSKIKYNAALEKYWKLIREEVNPDIVHIHGTEYAHGLAWIKACGNNNVVASIQGLTSVYFRYSTGYLSNYDILKNITPEDIKNRSSIYDYKRDFKRRGRIEEKYIKSLKYIIGRTKWDECHALTINPGIQYLFCNETLRPAFYDGKWEYSLCEKHSIFISQAKGPIKGCHMMLKALPLILRKYPDAKLYIGNSTGIKAVSFIEKLKQSGYQRLLRNLILKFRLEKSVVFLPALDEQEMRNHFLRSHVFVNASSIENSPNSLGEAQLLGVPCVSSYVGGTPEFMGYGKAGTLYRFEEYEMLADAVCRIFMKGYIQSEIDEGRSFAIERHHPQINAMQLLNIYNEIHIASK